MNTNRSIFTIRSIFTCFLAAALFTVRVFAGPGDGHVVSVTKIQDNGADNSNFNIVIMGDGYQADEMATFEARAQDVLNAFNAQVVYGPCSGAVNFYRVNIESDDSGVDKPAACYGASAVSRNTYLDVHYCASGTQRCIGSSNSSLVITTATNATAHWNFVVVLANDTEYGGCAWGDITYNSTGINFERIVVHELGHAIGNLADEYEEFSNTYSSTVEPSDANLTIQTNRGNVKWFDLILETTPVATWNKSDCTVFSAPPATWNGIVGTYEGGGRQYTCGIYRPSPNCLMRSSAQPFCPVCARRIQQVLMGYFDGSNLSITPWGYFKSPKTSPYWQTPDVWCDNNANGVQEPGEPSIGKADNHLFARITNTGGAASGPFEVRFTYVPFTGVINLANEQLIRTISRPALAAGITDEVEVLWDLTSIPPAFAGVNHFCVIVEILADECNTFGNKAQNNFANVSTAGPTPAPVSFYIKNILDANAVGSIQITPEPPAWQITANVPDIKTIPLKPKEEKLITIEFKYLRECKAGGEKVRPAGNDICARENFDVSYVLNGQMLGGVSAEVVVYPPRKKWSWSIHLGTAIPGSELDRLYKPGLMAGLDADYHFTNQFSLVGLLAINRFKADGPGVSDTHWFNLSLNGKYEFGNNPFRPYLNLGPGLYIPKSGSSKFGFNSGVGVTRTITTSWTAEAGFNYHRIFANPSDLDFFAAHLGLIYRF